MLKKPKGQHKPKAPQGVGSGVQSRLLPMELRLVLQGAVVKFEHHPLEVSLPPLLAAVVFCGQTRGILRAVPCHIISRPCFVQGAVVASLGAAAEFCAILAPLLTAKSISDFVMVHVY